MSAAEGAAPMKSNARLAFTAIARSGKELAESGYSQISVAAMVEMDRYLRRHGAGIDEVMRGSPGRQRGLRYVAWPDRMAFAAKR